MAYSILISDLAIDSQRGLLRSTRARMVLDDLTIEFRRILGIIQQFLAFARLQQGSRLQFRVRVQHFTCI